MPAYGMVLVLLTYFTYFALALAGTPAFADLRTITGEPPTHSHPRARAMTRCPVRALSVRA